jgi:uncharacterized protein (DUF169 family)
MAKFDILHKHGDELEKRIRLQTFPLGIKLLEKEAEIPAGAERPLKNLGYRMPICQAYAMSRREGKTIAMFKEDMLCCEPVIGYGWAEPPQYFLEGNNRFPHDVKDLRAGQNYANDFPRLEAGKYTGAVSAPLNKINFEPDAVLFYCDSEQLSLLLLGREFEDGHDLKCSLSSHAACVYSVVPAIKTVECCVAVPCRGDRYIALARHDEVIFSVPTQKLESLLAGLRHVEKYDCRFPKSPGMVREPEMPESYVKLSRMLGCQ